MWFSLFSTILILAVTFYQGLQGLFTGMINCILAILSAAVAFGFYENLYFAFLIDHQPDYGRAIALIGIFVITMLVLRAIVDSLVKGNVHFPVYVDRAGGGIFGLITAMIIVGMLGIGFQMLPFPPDFLGFSRFKVVQRDSGEEIPWRAKKGEDPPLLKQDWSQLELRRRMTWFNADGFTVALASHLSANALRGREDVSFGEIHPDFLVETFAAKGNPLGAARLTAKVDSLQIVGVWEAQPHQLFVREYVDRDGKPWARLKRADIEPGRRMLIIRASVRDARDDSGSVVRFTPELVRLFVRERPDAPLSVEHLWGINDDAKGANNSLVRIFPGEPIGRPEGEMDFVFSLSENAQPEFLEFKQNARKEVPRPDEKKIWTPIGVKAAPVAAQPPRPSQVRPPQQATGAGGGAVADSTYGRVNVLGPADGVSISDALPFSKPLTNYGGGQAQISGGIVKGVHHLVSTLGPDWQPVDGNQPPVERFEVPEGMRLLQVSVERLQAGSTLGRAQSFAIENIGDFYLKAEGDKPFRPVGVYAMARVGGQNIFELIYLDETERDMARLPKFSRIKGTDLQGDYALVYLFHVPPGTRPLEIHTGRRPVDLRHLNIEVR